MVSLVIDSYQRNRTYNFFLGLNTVIDGVDMGMTGMCVGEAREIVIPPELGYGSATLSKKSLWI